MMKLFCALLFCLTIIMCGQKISKEKANNARSDIRLGTRFYSIFLNEEGEAYVIRGKGSYYTDSLQIVSSDTSSVFKLDSSKIFFETLKKLKSNPTIVINRTGTAPRAEVYYQHHKVYDGYGFDTTFWEIFRPIMEQIPKGYNPFRVDDRPF